MEYIDVKQFKGKVRQDARKVTFKNVHGKTNAVVFSYQKTKFGFKRFFCCPYCQKRVQKLYYVDHNYKCRECSGINPYRGIKNMTKGGADEIAYRMKTYAAKYDIEFDFPFNYLEYANDDRNKKDSFRKHLIILQGLENMRFQAVMKQTTYTSKFLSSVCRGKHPLLKSESLWDLKNWFYDWGTGERIIVQNPRNMIKM